MTTDQRLPTFEQFSRRETGLALLGGMGLLKAVQRKARTRRQ